jgi:HEAT repeat protein
MQMAYTCEDDPVVRSMIVEAIWQHRQPSVVTFLADVLRDPTPMVWRQALDGLVTLASPESIRVLRSAADGEIEAGRRAWIEEAIEQATDAIARR